jgi:Ran GTPase-activating protein (RanGAP) involved in mRNA processing and transport
MAHLADSPHLRRLRILALYRNNLGDAGAEHLARAGWLSGVQTLELGDNGLSGRGVRALALSTAFHPVCLRLGNNQPDAEALSALASSPSAARLVNLALDSCQLGTQAAAALADATGLGALRCLDLNDNPLGDEGAAELARASWLGHLAGLKVNGCGLTPAGEELLSRRQGG